MLKNGLSLLSQALSLTFKSYLKVRNLILVQILVNIIQKTLKIKK